MFNLGETPVSNRISYSYAQVNPLGYSNIMECKSKFSF